MEHFDEVVIVSDARFAEVASRLRGALEAFPLRIRYVRLAQIRQFQELFAGRMLPLDGFTILASHGFKTETGEPGLRFEAVDNPSGDPKTPTGWEQATFDLTPASVADHVTGLGGTVLSLACGGGHQALASAFLDAGVARYIGNEESYHDMGAAVLFCVGLFYFLLAADRDFAPRGYSIADAVARASGIDEGWPYGTEGYRLYCRPDDPGDVDS